MSGRGRRSALLRHLPPQAPKALGSLLPRTAFGSALPPSHKEPDGCLGLCTQRDMRGEKNIIKGDTRSGPAKEALLKWDQVCAFPKAAVTFIRRGPSWNRLLPVPNPVPDKEKGGTTAPRTPHLQHSACPFSRSCCCQPWQGLVGVGSWFLPQGCSL